MLTINEQTQVQKWLEAEKNGDRFPVNFDIAWSMAGYSKKANAKRKLTNQSSYLVINEDYKVTKGDVLMLRSEQSELNGRSDDQIVLSCDAFKHFCLMAQTPKGREIRQYFIEAEKALKNAIPLCQTLAKENELLKSQLQAIPSGKKFSIHYDGRKFYLCTVHNGKVIPLFEQIGPDASLARADYETYLLAVNNSALAIEAICEAFNNLSKILTPVNR